MNAYMQKKAALLPVAQPAGTLCHTAIYCCRHIAVK